MPRLLKKCRQQMHWLQEDFLLLKRLPEERLEVSQILLQEFALQGDTTIVPCLSKDFF